MAGNPNEAIFKFGKGVDVKVILPLSLFKTPMPSKFNSSVFNVFFISLKY
jgi:hypothetical protein